MPSILEIEKNISFRIINSHHSMTFARPKMPSLTYIAGIHIKPVKELPTDVQVSTYILEYIVCMFGKILHIYSVGFSR